MEASPTGELILSWEDVERLKVLAAWVRTKVVFEPLAQDAAQFLRDFALLAE